MDTVEEALTWCFDHGATVSFGKPDGQDHAIVQDCRKGQSRLIGSGRTLVKAVNDSIKNIQEEKEALQQRRGG